MQFIACLDPIEGERGAQPWALTPEAYGKFLCGLFDVYYRDWVNGDYTSVRLFDDYIHMAMGMLQAPVPPLAAAALFCGGGRRHGVPL